MSTAAAYAAGLFDGEGTVSIRVEDRATGSRVHVLQIQIGMCDPVALRWMSEHFGGNVRGPVERPVPNRPIYFWQLSAARAADFLVVVRPYLVVKARQADVALRLRETNGHKRGPGRLLHSDVIAARDALKEELRVLNRRGRPAPAGV